MIEVLAFTAVVLAGVSLVAVITYRAILCVLKALG